MADETDAKETDAAGGDGPRYKISAFLFGNVDKRGELEEEYVRSDKEVYTAINNIDNCHVVEVETTIRSIVAEPASDQSVSLATSEPDLQTPVEIADYYDETEVIKLDAIDNALPTDDNDEVST